MPLLLCNGMNRAGSTLQYNLARGLVEGASLGQGEGYILDADVPTAALRLADWAADATWHVVKAHLLPASVADLLAAGNTLICYIYRDIRAVAVSYRRVWNFDPTRLDDELDRAVATYHAVHALDGPILRQRYETVIADLPAATRQIVHLCRWPVADSLIESVAADCSAANMTRRQHTLEQRLADVPLSRYARSLQRRILRRLGLWRPRQDRRRKHAIAPDTLLHPGHLSPTVGQPDAWRQQLSPAEIARLTRRYQRWLHEAGYLEAAPP